jgi:hypothetical protein
VEAVVMNNCGNDGVPDAVNPVIYTLDELIDVFLF